MEKKEVTAVNRVEFDGITVIPVSKITVNRWQGKRGLGLSGYKRPDSVVIITPSITRAFRITGEEISLSQILREIPEIGELR